MSTNVRTESLSVGGVEHPVAILYDRVGVPHIRARSAWDAFFAQGFVHARDRLWHMERDRRQAYGEWAAVVGPAAVAGDLLARRLRVRHLVTRDHAALAPATRAMLAAYSAGVNACVGAAPALSGSFGRHGVSFAAWQPWDSLAVFVQRHLAMGGWEGKIWRAHLAQQAGIEAVARIYAPFALDETAITLPGELLAPIADSEALMREVAQSLAGTRTGEEDASNSWVVSGRRTKSGKPLLGGDPHRTLDMPNVYYQNHLAAPSFDAIGFSMPGVPGISHFGHNAEVAWAITHGHADTGDLYLERERDMRVVHHHVESVPVRGSDPVALAVVWTENGAVIEGPKDGLSLALRLPELVDVNTTADAFVPMLEAASAAALEEAMRPWVAPVQNLVVADRAGHIAYRTRGRLPVRTRSTAYLPVPGWEPAYRWQGYAAFEAMPSVHDPAAGFVATANNAITAPGGEPYVATHFTPNHRARRLESHLKNAQGLTMADMERIHGDLVSLAARDAVAVLDHVEADDPTLRRALARLATWDGTMLADRPEPLIYAQWREALVDRLIDDLGATPPGALPPLAATGAGAMLALVRGRVFALARRDDRRPLRPGATWPELLTATLHAAVAALAARFGPDLDTWRWGAMHVLPPGGGGGEAEGPFGFALPGDTDTVRVSGYDSHTGFRVRTGSVARYAFDLADWDRSGWVVPHGAGGESGHPHFRDQVEAWRAARLLPMPYGAEAVAAATTAELCLTPSHP